MILRRRAERHFISLYYDAGLSSLLRPVRSSARRKVVYSPKGEADFVSEGWYYLLSR
ncbi:MAG: hypothetical protein G01um101430_545 [Parcubacteria group bacterium Gr01-1014_30]|nr:MAG: hypothetical protein G01um101430_545 [Parcubacteria group bacterium Gr01-1014_30]